jgi:hypothetical protein
VSARSTKWQPGKPKSGIPKSGTIPALFTITSGLDETAGGAVSAWAAAGRQGGGLQHRSDSDGRAFAFSRLITSV